MLFFVIKQFYPHLYPPKPTPTKPPTDPPPTEAPCPTFDYKETGASSGKTCGQSEFWNGDGVAPTYPDYPEFPFQVQVTNNVGPFMCGGAIVNQWFVITHAQCCPASSVQTFLNGGVPIYLNIYRSFTRGPLCLVQLLQPLDFTDYKIQPVCIDFDCPSEGSKAMAVQYLNSIETTSYLQMAPTTLCSDTLGAGFDSGYEMCTAPLQTSPECDLDHPQMLGQPLVGFDQGCFILNGILATANMPPPGAPYDAAGYAATCKENEWLHLNAFCGASINDVPPSWVLGLYQADVATLDQFPFFVAVKGTEPLFGSVVVVSGAIVGPYHVITTSGLTTASEIAYGMTVGNNPQDGFNSLPASRKISVSSLTPMGSFLLLTLDSPLPFFNGDGTLNKQVQPICLPADCSFPGAQPKVGEFVQVAGIGDTSCFLGIFCSSTDSLRYDEYEVKEPDAGSTTLAFITNSYSIDYHFHAQAKTCWYDHGGPVFIKRGDKYFLISIIKHIGSCDTSCNIYFFMFIFISFQQFHNFYR